MHKLSTKTALHRRQAPGFTLIEVLVTVAIIGILAAVALPSYQQYIIRGKRAAAQSQMLDIANREQQFLLANRIYADKTTLEANGFGLPNEVSSNYSYTITVGIGIGGVGAMPSYLITFIPSGTQASDGNITLDSEGVKSPIDKW